MSNNLSRRSFMKGAAALAAVSALSGALSGCGSALGGVSVIGSRTGSFTIQEGLFSKTLTVSVRKVQNFEYYTNLLVELDVANGAGKAAVKMASAASEGYVLVPTVQILDEVSSVNADLVPDGLQCEDVAPGKTEEAEVLIDTGIKGWAKLELTLTLYNGSEAVGDPVVFTFRK